MSMWIILRGDVLLILLGLEYRVLIDLILHRSSINNSANLSNKFGGFYFIFKFGISGLPHHVVTALADRIRELLEYMDVHANDASESSEPSWGKCVLWLPCQLPGEVVYTTSLSMVFEVFCIREKNWMLVWGEADSDFVKKKSKKKAFKTCCMDLGEVNPTHAYYNGSCTSKDTEDPCWSKSFKTRRTQKTSSALEVLWKTLFVLHLYLLGTL
ncbi:hypothetical protein Tco_0926615 [Tanacetum coccineum]|uniref:Uncharacterized protein n=1 Tax=Tanacetum coccineum TaxID=301880 RepID=A0ABQ5DD92_9ASTR